MMPSVEEQVERFRKATAKIRAEINTPAKARAFLVSAGILPKRMKSKPAGRPAKRTR